MPAEGMQLKIIIFPPPPPEEIFYMRAIIFANGIIDPELQSIPSHMEGDVVIAVDGGANNSLLCGIRPDIVIGDSDSISEQEKILLSNEKTRFIDYPQDKDQSDLELALDYALQIGFEEVFLLGLLGGRLDQTLANLLLLSKDSYSPLKLIVSAGLDTAHLLRAQDAITIEAKIGDIVSIIPFSSVVSGVTTHGLRWPLNKAKLEFGSTLSISNEMNATCASIGIDGGKLLVIHRRVGNAK
jgi:thiamine pyrophosphokinase